MPGYLLRVGRTHLPLALHTVIDRYGWLLAFAACGILSYLVIWQRGMLTDDYSFRAQVVDAESGYRRIFVPHELNRFLAFLVDVNLAGLLPEYELFVRLLASLVTAANALLLGLFVFRLTRSRLMALATAWLFLAPFYAHQAVLWVAAYLYIFSVFFALLYVHAAMSALLAKRAAWRWAGVAVLCYVLAIGFGEQAALALALVPAAAIALANQGRLPDNGVAARRLTVLVLAPAVLAVAYVALGYSGGDIVSTRGGMNLSLPHLLSQTETFAARLVQLTLRPNTGLRLINEAFRLGARTLLASPLAALLFVIAAGSALASAALWRSDDSDTFSLRSAVALLVGGALWFVAATFFPGIALVKQTLTVRMLYVPMAGAAVCAAGLAWLLARRLDHSIGEKAAVLCLGGVLLFSSVCMVGHARAYQTRYQLDQQQLASLAEALPARFLPADKPYIVAIELDERLFGGYDGLSQTLIGVFQTGWSARAGLRHLYHRHDISSFADVGWVIRPVEFRDAIGGQQEQVLVAGEAVPVDQTLLFAYRSRRTTIIESLSITQRDGQQRTVRFPLAEKMSAGGLPTLKNYPVSLQGKTFSGQTKEFGGQ